MRYLKIVLILITISPRIYSQNDLDAIRYSRNGVGGSSRFVAMGGAFGAVGADLSCAAYNPAGLALFRRGDVSFSGGLKFTNNQGKIYKKSASVSDANFVFNNFGVAVAWQSSSDNESRHVLAFTNTQIQNFRNSSTMSAYTNSTSIARDMLNLANEKNTPTALNSSYESLGFNTFVLDTAANKFFSFVDLKRTVKQTRDILNSGKVNDLNFSYAYAFKDKFYFGVSLGVPQINFVSTTTHTEFDDKDSMKVTMTSPNSYTSTYSGGLPVSYPDKLGFNSLTYEEYFKTTGSGFNLKLGAIMRLNDIVRVGFYYHTPTIYRLTDVYYNKMSASFDKKPDSLIVWQDPRDGGTFDYRIITPSRLGANAAFVIGKKGVIGLDYELVDYRNAQLSSSAIADFSGVNSVIKSKYKIGHNLRTGVEFNLSPVMLRLGYAMQGSPFGEVISGTFVRNTFSAGGGFRTDNNFYFDFTVSKTLSDEDYYLFTTLDTKARINFNSTVLAATVGFKF